MDLSVIIVSYNVKHFLYQCIDSVLKSSEDISTEIIVVDNHSSDGSAEMVAKKFKNVKLITNDFNIGFGRANNQALKQAKGEFTLFLNPDTILPEDCLKKCLEFFEKKGADICSLGIKMIDGSGRFLPESKRSFPSPEVAFYKLFGLSKLFPSHKKFGKYHLGYLNKNKNHPIDVISGAFLIVKTKTIKNKNGFDEDYFMYGEDIDLSHRLLENGCNNWYFAKSTIIHYKGESTNKGNLNYVKHFYKAMIIFAKKHFQDNNASLFIWMLQAAIFFRGILSVVAAIISKLRLQLIDSLFILASLFIAKTITFNATNEIAFLIIPLYLFIYLITMYFSGAYDKPYRLFKIIRGTLFSTVIIVIFHSIFPKMKSFSWFYIILSAILIIISYTIVRLIIQYTKTKHFSLYGSQKNRVIIVGKDNSLQLATELFMSPPQHQFLGLISDDLTADKYIGTLANFKALITKLKPTDIIFDLEFVTYKQIIQSIEGIQNFNIRYLIAHKDNFIISSENKDVPGSILTPKQIFAITKPEEKRKKRLLDITISGIGILFSPVLIWFQESASQYLNNCFTTLIGTNTWVGYTYSILPNIKKSIIKVGMSHNESIARQMETNYARFYSVYEDIDIIQRNWKKLGSKP